MYEVLCTCGKNEYDLSWLITNLKYFKKQKELEIVLLAEDTMLVKDE
jgi:hypothetical protein